jgi:hypothetical protein
MSERITRTIQIALPGGRTSAESIAQIIDTLFTKGLEDGERVDSIVGSFGDMAEILTLKITVSAPAEYPNSHMMGHVIVEDERR